MSEVVGVLWVVARLVGEEPDDEETSNPYKEETVDSGGTDR